MNVYKLKKPRRPKILWNTINQRNLRKEMSVRDIFYNCRRSVDIGRRLSIRVLKKYNFLRDCMTLKLSRTPRIKPLYQCSRRSRIIPTFKQFSFADDRYEKEYYE